MFVFSELDLSWLFVVIEIKIVLVVAIRLAGFCDGLHHCYQPLSQQGFAHSGLD